MFETALMMLESILQFLEASVNVIQIRAECLRLMMKAS